MLNDILDGIQYIKKNETLMLNVIIMAVVCTFAMNLDVIIPVFSKEVLGRGADGYTALLSMTGLGAFIGAIIMAYISKNGIKRSLLLYSGIATAVFQIMTIFTRQYLISSILILIVGFFNLVFINTANSIFQLHSSNEYRGRVMSVYSFLNVGSTPIGNFLSGAVMENMGGAFGFVFCGGTSLLLMGLIIAIKRKPIFRWLSNTSTQ